MLLSTVSQKAPPLEEHPDTSFISNSTETQNSTGADVRRVPHVKLSTLLEESGLSFDTIVANCEGCLKAVLESFPQVPLPLPACGARHAPATRPRAPLSLTSNTTPSRLQDRLLVLTSSILLASTSTPPRPLLAAGA